MHKLWVAQPPQMPLFTRLRKNICYYRRYSPSMAFEPRFEHNMLCSAPKSLQAKLIDIDKMKCINQNFKIWERRFKLLDRGLAPELSGWHLEMGWTNNYFCLWEKDWTVASLHDYMIKITKHSSLERNWEKFAPPFILNHMPHLKSLRAISKRVPRSWILFLEIF